MKCRVKKMVLPDAPEPTRPRQVMLPEDEMEKERCLRLKGIGEPLFVSRAEHEQKKNKRELKQQELWPEYRVIKLKRLWRQGDTITAIAREMRMELYLVKNKLRRMIKSGEIEGRKKHLAPEQKKELVSLYHRGVGAKELSKQFGISDRTVYLIVGGTSNEENNRGAIYS